MYIYESAFGPIRVMTRKTDGVTSYVQNGCYHSQADRNGISVCGYIHVMHRLIAAARARRVLIIGCAGGTLATMLRREGRRVTVLDIDHVAFLIARRHFQMPDSVRCVRRDGIAFLRQNNTRYDAIVIDAFTAGNRVPAVFKTKRFFASVKSRLSPRGSVLMNVMIAGDEDAVADRIGNEALASGLPTSLFTLPGTGWRNCIILGGHVPRVRFSRSGDAVWLRDELAGVERRRPQRWRSY